MKALIRKQLLLLGIAFFVIAFWAIGKIVTAQGTLIESKCKPIAVGSSIRPAQCRIIYDCYTWMGSYYRFDDTEIQYIGCGQDTVTCAPDHGDQVNCLEYFVYTSEDNCINDVDGVMYTHTTSSCD